MNTDPRPRLILIRGLPGEGKTTRALEYQEQFRDDGTKCTVVSADDFMVDSNNRFCYDPRRIAVCHALCLTRAITDLPSSVVVVHNTFVKNWEMAPYRAAARALDRSVLIVSVRDPDTDLAVLAERNVHGVPLVHIQKMASEWEGASSDAEFVRRMLAL